MAVAAATGVLGSISDPPVQRGMEQPQKRVGAINGDNGTPCLYWLSAAVHCRDSWAYSLRGGLRSFDPD